MESTLKAVQGPLWKERTKERNDNAHNNANTNTTTKNNYNNNHNRKKVVSNTAIKHCT